MNSEPNGKIETYERVIKRHNKQSVHECKHTGVKPFPRNEEREKGSSSSSIRLVAIATTATVWRRAAVKSLSKRKTKVNCSSSLSCVFFHLILHFMVLRCDVRWMANKKSIRLTDVFRNGKSRAGERGDCWRMECKILIPQSTAVFSMSACVCCLQAPLIIAFPTVFFHFSSLHCPDKMCAWMRVRCVSYVGWLCFRRLPP